MAHLYRRKNKRFPDSWYVYYYKRGKKKKKWAGYSKADAQTVKRDIEEQLARERAGIAPAIKKISCQDAIEKYLEYSKANKSERTYLLDEHILKNLFLQFLQKHQVYEVGRIYPELLDEFKNHRLTQDKVKKVTHNREITSIKTFFSAMVKWGYLPDNRAAGLKKLRLPINLARFLTKEEIKDLLGAADTTTRPIIEMFLYTGLRRNELRFLRWQDVDMANKRVIVQNREGFHTKNYQPRVIPMHPKLFEIFQEISKAKKNGQYVFSNRQGDVRSHISRDVGGVIKEAKLEGVSVHTLRHTFASHLAMAGVPIRTIQILMGHANITTTMIYAHLSPEHLQGAVEKLGF